MLFVTTKKPQEFEMKNETIKLAVLAALWMLATDLFYTAMFMLVYVSIKSSLFLLRKAYRIHYTNTLIKQGMFYKG